MGKAWSDTRKNFNRYIQKLRRLHNVQVQYIRTVEAHADSYPHIHIILQFTNPISVDNARYFDKLLYRQWKQLWTFGLSDYQPPRSKRLPLLYIIKYISKSSSSHRTVWKKILVNVTATQDSTPSHAPTAQETTTNPTLELCKIYKIRQCQWSRKFVFPHIPPRPKVALEQTLLDLPRN